MATGTTLCNRAVRLLGQLASGKTLGTNELNEALEALNAMADAWKIEGLMIYALQEESLTLTSGVASKTIGPSGSLITTRPVDIEQAWVVDSSSITHPVERMEEVDYAAISLKTQSGDYPSRYLYRGTMPDATVVLHPVPNQTITMKLLTRVLFGAFTSGGTVSLPPGYEKAIAYNLALELAPEYETQASEDVVMIARASKGVIKAHNIRPVRASSGLEGFGRTGYDVRSDG